MDILFVPLLSTRFLARSGLSASLSLSPNRGRISSSGRPCRQGLGTWFCMYYTGFHLGSVWLTRPWLWLIPDHPITMLLSYCAWFTVMYCSKWCDQSAGLCSLTLFYYYKSLLLCKLSIVKPIDQNKTGLISWPEKEALLGVKCCKTELQQKSHRFQVDLMGSYWYQLGEMNTFSTLFELCHELRIQNLSPKDAFSSR